MSVRQRDKIQSVIPYDTHMLRGAGIFTHETGAFFGWILVFQHQEASWIHFGGISDTMQNLDKQCVGICSYRYPSSPSRPQQFIPWNEYWVEIDPLATGGLLGTTTTAISLVNNTTSGNCTCMKASGVCFRAVNRCYSATTSPRDILWRFPKIGVPPNHPFQYNYPL